MQPLETQGQHRGVPLLPWAPAGPASERLIPFIYLAISLPVALYLCFLIPPMQVRDEGRHFLRACQIADGGIISEIEASRRHVAGCGIRIRARQDGALFPAQRGSAPYDPGAVGSP